MVPVRVTGSDYGKTHSPPSAPKISHRACTMELLTRTPRAAHSSSDLLSARAIQAKSLLLRSHLFSIETAEQRRFTQASISSQKNATLWSIFAPLQGCRQLKC